MASLELDTTSGHYRVRFRFDGQSYKRSTRTKDLRRADGLLGQVQETLRQIELGLVQLPSHVEPGAFIVSGARSKRENLPRSPIRTLADLFRIYQEELPEGSKEKNTLRGERLHIRHMLRIVKGRTPITTITTHKVQLYIESRLKERHQGRLIGPNTIKKEITTLKMIWNWAIKQGYLTSSPPVVGIVYPKLDEKPHFMTFHEINQILARNEVTKEQANKLWESLFLTKPEGTSLLACVQKKKSEEFIYPMFVLAAHTGNRRSELVRMEATDFDFESRTLLVREKKRSRKHATSFRRLPMSDLVETTFKKYLKTIPYGNRALSRPDVPILAEDTISHFFKAVLKETVWESVRGFHVLRHSFASNAASEGIDQRIIDDWMGHQTEEMRRRYRHMTPNSQKTAIDYVFNS